MEKQVVVRFEGVSFAYNGEPALTDVSLRIAEGDFTSILGPNGGGKTTLLRLILGLVKPQQGSVQVLGQSPERARSRIGYVPQLTHFDPLFPVTVLEVVLMGRLGRSGVGPYRQADLEAASAALKEVGLEGLHRRAFSELSGGQRQKVLIARALSTWPSLLLLDEPTANVDRLGQQNLYELLRQLNAKLTIMLVSHDIGVVSKFATHVLCVNRTVYMHPTRELTGEMVSELYGGNIALVRHRDRIEETAAAPRTQGEGGCGDA